MRSYHPMLKLFSFVLMISCIIAKNPVSKPDKNEHPPFKMFSEDMLEKGEWGYDPETNSGWFGIREDETPSGECVTPEREAEILRRLDENIAYLRERGLLPETPSRVPTDFTWPLEPTENFTANDYWAISGFVDHDPSSNWADYFCYGRTYNGHNGTDYYLWPHQFNMMDNDEVAIVAAAPGTIIDKVDGNYDRRCYWGGFQWNAVYIMHDDGSTAWYGHMKTNSLTGKWVGDTVERGEYLGLVGSSGDSQSPHLHFEVRDVDGVVVDPYEGPCNDIDESHWEDQHAYRVTALLRGGNYGMLSWWMDCPEPSILNYRNHVVDGDLGYGVGYFRDVIQGNPIYYQTISPNGNVIGSITINPDGDYSNFWWWWGGLQSGAFPPGIYTYRIIVNGESHDFPFYWEMDGCTDPTADNYDPSAVFDNGTCMPCNTGSEIKIELNFDNWPDETFWTVNDAGNVNNLMSGGGFTGSTVDQYCASPGTYQVTIYDTYGDGMCCGFGDGGYSIYVDDVLLAEGGNFLYEEVTTVVIEGGGPGTVETEYSSGWNLVGLPVETEDSSYGSLFPTAFAGSLYSFDGGYSEVEQLDNGTGYWLRFPESSTVEFTGGMFDEISVPVVEGWNIVSGPSEGASLWDPNGLVYEGTVYGFNGSYVNTDIFEPGKGYWLRSSGDGTITLSSNPSSAKQSTSIRDRYISQSTKIQFRNSDGKTIELYTGGSVAELELPMFSVPPLPPSTGFDVRFGEDFRYAESGGKLTVLNDAYPLRISCTFSDNGPLENWVLVNEQTGEKYSLSSQDELLIGTPVNTLTLRRATPVIPETFTLHQNFPNPFNPITTLSYDLPKDSDVRLAIFDMLGNEVATLVSTSQQAGFRSVHWDATDSMGRPVSAGVYLYQIHAGEFVQTKKMVLLK